MGLMSDLRKFAAAPPAPQMFGNAGREHMEKYGTTKEHCAKIAYKNHRNSVNNPYSQFRDEYTLEDIQNSKEVYMPLTKLQCCPTSDGAACAIVATDLSSTFDDKSCIKMIGSDMTKLAAETALSQAGKTAADVQVVELHDCFSANELVTYEALGLCPEGKAGDYIDQGNNDYGGKGAVVNPSGGLISKGHPLGATGLAQCAEMVWQCRGEAGKRQVDGVKVALSHNLGLGGAAVVTVYERPGEWRARPMKRAVSLAQGPTAASKL